MGLGLGRLTDTDAPLCCRLEACCANESESSSSAFFSQSQNERTRQAMILGTLIFRGYISVLYEWKFGFLSSLLSRLCTGHVADIAVLTRDG